MQKRQCDTELILIRHASTLWNEQELYQGRQDIPLSPKGLRDLAAISVPEDIRSWVLYASPLQRAMQTAQVLFGHDPIPVPQAVEQDFGEWEGKSRNLVADPGWKGLDDAPPGGESIRQVQDRMTTWLIEFYKNRKPGVLVTHKGVILALVSRAFDWNAEGKKPFKIQSGKMHRLEVLPNGKLKVLELNVEFSSK